MSVQKCLIVSVFNVTYKLFTKTTDFSPKKLLAISFRIAGRRKINIQQILIDNGIHFKHCNACNNLSQYSYVYDIKYVDDKIYLNISNVKYPLYNEYERLYCGKCLLHLNTNSIERVSKIYNISKEEANKIILERNKSPFYEHNHLSKEAYCAYQTRDKEWYINKYGELEGIKKFTENINKLITAGSTPECNIKKDSMSLDYCIKKHNGDLNKAKEERLKRQRDSSSNLENKIRRYGKEVGTKKYNEQVKRCAYTNTIEYYNERYGPINGPIKFNEWKKAITCSLSLFINKYGKELGEIKYKKWLFGITSPHENRKTYSKECALFFDKLRKEITPIDIKYAKDERFIQYKDETGKFKIVFYDGYIKELNLLIEYDTPRYHPNPNYLTEEEIIKLTYKGNYDHDVFKENLSIEMGYDFYRVFIKTEKNKQEEYEKLINYIKSKL